MKNTRTAIVLVALLALPLSGCGSGIGKPSSVTVTGQVRTIGFRTHPTSVDFVDAASQAHHVAPTSADGNYSISLPNRRAYNVHVSWAGLLGTAGTCNAGILTLDATDRTQRFDGNC